MNVDLTSIDLLRSWIVGRKWSDVTKQAPVGIVCSPHGENALLKYMQIEPPLIHPNSESLIRRGLTGQSYCGIMLFRRGTQVDFFRVYHDRDELESYLRL
jgi:hypothetical protein